MNLEAEGVISHGWVGWELEPGGAVPCARSVGRWAGLAGGCRGRGDGFTHSREGCEAGHPGTVHLGTCTQPLQHGGCRVTRLLPWPLGAPRKDSPRDKE